jgi:hypothetical protein
MGNGDEVELQTVASGWETEFPLDGQSCVDDLCCRIAVVETASSEEELEGLMDRLFDGSRIAPPIEGWGEILVLVASNQACRGDERLYSHTTAIHDGPDVRWEIRLDIGDRQLVGPGRSFLIATTPFRRYRSVVPDLTVGFIDGD